MYNSSFLAGFNSRQLLSTDFQTNSTKCNRCFPHDYNHSLQWRKAESVCGYSIKNHSANYHCYCSYKIAHKTNSNSNACLATTKFEDTLRTLSSLWQCSCHFLSGMKNATAMTTTGYFQLTWSLSTTGPWHTHTPFGSKNLAPSLCLSLPVLLLTALPWLLYW